MKILFVANRFPYPPFRGDKLKIYNLAKQLCLTHELHLITIAQDKNDLQFIDKLQPIFNNIEVIYFPKWRSFFSVLLSFFNKKPFQVNYFYSRKFYRALRKINLANYDAIHIQHLRMAQYFNHVIPENAILDLPDAFSLYWLRKVNNEPNMLKKLLIKIEYNRLKKYEKITLPRFILNLVCSEEDATYLKQLCNITNIEILKNGVDTNTFFPVVSAEKNNTRILFTGNMDYAPNVDAVIYFAQEIFPIILKTIPNAEFIIAGQRPVAKVLALQSTSIKVTGFIPNLADEYSKATIVVAPLRIGAGTQNKVLESMAMGIPVVCTNIGFKGIGAANGQGIYCETSSSGFANRCIELLNNPKELESIGKKGSDYIQQHFSWEKIARQMETYFKWIG